MHFDDSYCDCFFFLRPSARCAKVFQLSRKFITQEVRAINSLRGELQRMGLGGKLGPWKQLTSGGHAILLFNKVTPIPVTIPYVKTMLELPDTTFQESQGSYNSFDYCPTAIFALLASTSKLFWRFDFNVKFFVVSLILLHILRL
jgi:hypothetical protein